jgi:3-carboxy-cis,cis-muconate cycloisomerase
MPSRLIGCLGTTEEMAALFDDASVLGAMLQFEVALARVQARMNLIPQESAAAIQNADVSRFEAAAIAREARAAATLGLPFVEALKSQANTSDVHWGATSQDTVDTAMVLLLRRAELILARDHDRLATHLRSLSERHAETVMLARTLLQAAPPITFGYKVASWYGAVNRSWKRLRDAFGQALVLQFGGASGTLAAYSSDALTLASELAKELDLPLAPAPWHSQRDRMAALVTACAVYTGAIGKIARDVTLLMQTGIEEVAERGGRSSAMPNKRNPAGSVVVLAAANQAPVLAAAYLAGMTQEHERAAGGLQAEWQTVSRMIETTGSALAAIIDVLEGLTVKPERMLANLQATEYVSAGTGCSEVFRKRLLED